MKNVLLTRLWAPALALPLLLLSCQPQEKTADSPSKPLAVDPALTENVPFQDFTVNADEDDTILLPEGTSIFIPKGIFVDKNGNPVKGNIQLHYRAFYTAGQIIASGISMFYDTAGTNSVFTSAGMFEMNGEQGGQPISIAKGKNIEMNFASSQDDQPYNFYTLDTANAKWNYEYPTTAQPNDVRTKLESALAGLFSRPVEPQKFDPAKPVIDLDVDISDHPELKGYSGIMWQYEGTGDDPEKNKWIYDVDWQNAKLQLLDTNTCKYDLRLSDNTRNFSTHVVPAIRGTNYDEAIKKYRTDLLTFEADERDRQVKRKELAMTQAYQRRLMVSRFGISNCDRSFLGNTIRWIRARFHFANKSFQDHLDQVVIYVVTQNGRRGASYIADQNPEISYFEGSKTVIIAVKRGTGETAVMDGVTFASMAKGDANAVIDFDLEDVSTRVKSSDDIDALIKKL